MRRVQLLLAGLLLLALAPGVASARQVVALDGTWEAAAGELSAPPAPEAAWFPVSVPGRARWRPAGPHAFWYRREIDIPTSWAGERVVLRVGGAKYSQHVYVDGKRVGSHLGGFEPAEYDITPHVVCGETSELLIGVGDWTSLLAEGAKAGTPTDGQLVGSWVKGALTAPLGTMGGDVGLWGSVTLEGRPRVWIEEVQVEPLARAGRLRVAVVVRNGGVVPECVTVTARISQGGPGPRIAPAVIVLEAEKTETVTLEEDWPEARLWTPSDPHLYALVAGVSTGPLVDAREVTFGFRNFEAAGDVFLLNGAPTRLLAMDAIRVWPTGSPATVLAAARDAGATAVHLAGEPWPEEWYDAADRMGMMIVASTALWDMAPSYALDRDVFWTNARDHVTAVVKRLRHHPSIVMWDAEDRLLASGGASVAGAVEKVAALADAIHQADPTRPVMFNGDADPRGKADVISLSAPHEFPPWTQWPETAFWFGAPAQLDGYPGTRWQWNREKPFWLGGFLRLPATDVRSATLLLGGTAYPEVEQSRRAVEQALRGWQIVAARDAGVSAVSGWDIDPFSGTPLAPADQSWYFPLAAFDLSPNAEVFAGTVVTRPLSVMNDSLATRAVEVHWRLEPVQGRWQVAGRCQASLPPAGRLRIAADLPIPALAAEVTPAHFVIEIWEQDRLVFSTTNEWNVHGRAPLSGPVRPMPGRVAVYDPDCETLQVLARVGIKPTLLTEANAAHAANWAGLMIVGKGALRDPVSPTGSAMGQAMLNYARQGGTVLVFEQEAYPQWLIPVSLTDHDATVAFLRNPTHPALCGLDEKDLGHWVPDGLVSRHEMRKPNRVGFLPIVDSGGPDGLATAGLAELRVGAGRMILCQLDVTAKYGLDAAATRLTRNLLVYAGTKAPRPRRAAALVDDAEAAQLSAVGFCYDRIGAPLDRVNLSCYQLLVISDLAQVRGNERRLQRFVKRGGHVVLHNLALETVDAAARLTGHPMSVQPNPSGAVRLTCLLGPAAALSNEEFAWLVADPAAGLPALSPGIADQTLVLPALGCEAAYTSPVVLASVTSGRGLWVIDQVRWDRPGGHDAEAQRYLSTLLTSLGGTAVMPPALTAAAPPPVAPAAGDDGK
jgi:hypothetical protein